MQIMRANFNAYGVLAGDSLSLLPFESPESVSWKFSWANEMTIWQITSLIGAATSNIDEIWRLNLPGNLAKWVLAYDEDECFSRAMIRNTLREDDRILFETDHLRFCPVCLSAGYHTWWHQCRLHSECLVHGCSLISCCASCDAQVPFDRGANSSMKRPYICSRCQLPISGVAPTWDALEDFAAIKSILMSRYGPWVQWFSKLAEMRKGWSRIHEDGFSLDNDDRLYRLRSARELEAIRITCVPPESGTGSRSVRVIEVHVSNAVDYAPAEVVAQFVSGVKDSFDSTDHEHYQFCEQNFGNGFRIRAGHIRPVPLALYILHLYSSWCRERNKSNEPWCQNDASRDEVWVECLTSVIGGVRLGARDLCTLLKVIYSELLSWLSHGPTRECFDLEFDRLSLLPGISGYQIVDDDYMLRSVVLIRPTDEVNEEEEFCLVAGPMEIQRPRYRTGLKMGIQALPPGYPMPMNDRRYRFASKAHSARQAFIRDNFIVCS